MKSLSTKAKPYTVAELLPASYRTNDEDLAVPSPEVKYFLMELDIQKRNKIHDWLWIAGRPMPPRALTRQKMIGREIVIVEEMALHLTWARGRMFLKPIPAFLLEPDFWTKHIACPPERVCSSTSSPEKTGHLVLCDHSQVWQCALGFLLSYAALIAHESDFHIAKEHRLLPAVVTWLGWKSLVAELLMDEHIYQHINERFIYGELRLSRLNKIYRFTGLSILRGYQVAYSEYGDFIRDNFTWLASVFAYVAIMLTAMQVGLATGQLQSNQKFQAVSYGFTVFSILGPPVIILCGAVVLCVVFLSNWIATKRYKRKRFRHIAAKQEHL